MAKMYGKFVTGKRNYGGRDKSTQRQLEINQSMRDDQYPSQHVHGQICGIWGIGCEDLACHNYWWALNDNWDTYATISVFETYPVIYTTES